MKSLKVNGAPWWDAKLDLIGEEKMPIVMIDNFFPEPDILLQDAAAKDFQANAPYFPGIRAAILGAYFKPLMPGLSFLLKNVFQYASGIEVQEAHYSLTTTPPENLSMMQRLPHVDGGNDMKLALLHYLCGNEHGGTAFYKQVSTNYETVSAARFESFKAAVISDHERLGEPAAAYFNASDDRFEQIYKIEAKFNQAILYFGLNLHSVLVGEKALTPDPRTGRLTVNSFFTPLDS